MQSQETKARCWRDWKLAQETFCNDVLYVLYPVHDGGYIVYTFIKTHQTVYLKLLHAV